MPRTCQLSILSDVHYACAAEQARGDDFELHTIRNPLLRLFVRMHRDYVWLNKPLRKNHLLDRYLDRAGAPDFVVANGDYTCNSAFVGVSDDAACQSVRECLGKLRSRFGDRLRAIYGDHELGKKSFVGANGGMRLASFQRARGELGLTPFWQLELGRYSLFGVVSSLVGLPVYEADTLPEEREEWRKLRAAQLAEIREAFAAVKPSQRILLFCHDPTALPFLLEVPEVQQRLPQIEQTIIGHLHSNLILRQARLLAGLPQITFLGHTARRLTTALREGRHWKEFRIRLCPALAGIELLKDGGFYNVELDLDAGSPARFAFQPLPR
jgi:hypothetical protein